MTGRELQVNKLVRNKNDNIVKYYGVTSVFQDKKGYTLPVSFLMFIELCDTDIGNWMKRIDRMRVFDARRWFVQICSAFQYLHSKLYNLKQRRVCHMDIKPDNICVSYSPEYGRGMAKFKLCDFGRAIIFTTKHTMTLERDIGNRLTRAPEVFAGETQPYCARKADVFSLGCTLLVTLTGYDMQTTFSSLLFGAEREPSFSRYDLVRDILMGTRQLWDSDFYTVLGHYGIRDRPLIDLLVRMLSPTPEWRPHIEGVIQDKWTHKAWVAQTVFFNKIFKGFVPLTILPMK